MIFDTLQDLHLVELEEIDAILVAQDLGWPTLNGFSGNYPKGYVLPLACSRQPELILTYMHFTGITDHQFYIRMINRTVPIGFIGCDLH